VVIFCERSNEPQGYIRRWGFLTSYGLISFSSTLHSEKVKLSHYTPRRRLGNRSYSSYSFTTSALDGGEWSASRPGRALPSGKGPPVSIVQEAGWAPEPVWTQRLEAKSFRLCRGSNLDGPSSSPYPDAILTELPGSFLTAISTHIFF
jgi:hypothetical protein